MGLPDPRHIMLQEIKKYASSAEDGHSTSWKLTLLFDISNCQFYFYVYDVNNTFKFPLYKFKSLTQFYMNRPIRFCSKRGILRYCSNFVFIYFHSLSIFPNVGKIFNLTSNFLINAHTFDWSCFRREMVV